MKAMRFIAAGVVGIIGLSVSGIGHAADAVRGKTLFSNTNDAPQSCGSASCHSGFPSVQRNGIGKGSNPATILSAISGDKGGMRTLSPYVNAVDAADIAAYIANPAAANGSPVISFSATSVSFSTQVVGRTSVAQTITISNAGSATLTLTGLTLGGSAGADFTRTGTCTVGGGVAAGGNCLVQLTFRPTATGVRSGTLTITHNASGGASNVSLTGTGSPGPAVASVSPTAFSFTQTLNTSSLPQTLTVANTGGQSLTVSAVSITGAGASDFAVVAGSTCVAGAVVNGGTNCQLQLSFTPGASGARSATLSIAHSAATTPATVTLNGTGTATAQPAISLSTTSLTFAEQSIGSRSAAQSATVTNSGQAPLVLGALATGGTNGGDFTRAGTCAQAAAVAPGGNCSIQVSFAPSAIGTRTASLTVASNANNGSAVVALSGSAVQYVISVNPMAATLQAPVGTKSDSVLTVVANSGASPLTIESIAVSGPFLLQGGSNSCGVGPMVLSSGQSCNVYVAFQPTDAGAATGEVTITSTASATPTRVALSAQATAAEDAPTSIATGSAVNVGVGGCTIGAPDQLVDPTLALMLVAGLFAMRRRSSGPEAEGSSRKRRGGR